MEKAVRVRGTVAACILVAVALLAPVQSPAAVYSGCGGVHYGDASCNFTPIGAGISLFGTNNLSGGYGFIWVKVKDAVGNVIASCSGNGECFAWHSLVGNLSQAALPVPLGPFVCEVNSVDNGHYGCSSYIA